MAGSTTRLPQRGAPASAHSTKAVPSCAATAPSSSAARIARPSMMPRLRSPGHAAGSPAGAPAPPCSTRRRPGRGRSSRDATRFDGWRNNHVHAGVLGLQALVQTGHAGQQRDAQRVSPRDPVTKPPAFDTAAASAGVDTPAIGAWMIGWWVAGACAGVFDVGQPRQAAKLNSAPRPHHVRASPCCNNSGTSVPDAATPTPPPHEDRAPGTRQPFARGTAKLART